MPRMMQGKITRIPFCVEEINGNLKLPYTNLIDTLKKYASNLDTNVTVKQKESGIIAGRLVDLDFSSNEAIVELYNVTLGNTKPEIYFDFVGEVFDDHIVLERVLTAYIR